MIHFILNTRAENTSFSSPSNFFNELKYHRANRESRHVSNRSNQESRTISNRLLEENNALKKEQKKMEEILFNSLLEELF